MACDLLPLLQVVNPAGMSALGQKRSFVPGRPNVRFAPKAVMHEGAASRKSRQPVEAAQLLHKGSNRESPPQASARGAVIFASASRAACRSCAWQA